MGEEGAVVLGGLGSELVVMGAKEQTRQVHKLDVSALNTRIEHLLGICR